MNRLFGTSKRGPPPNLSDAIIKVDARVEGIERKIKSLDEEIAKYKEQLAKLPPTSPSRDSYKQRAMRALQQKKLYEQQVAQMRQQSFNMEQTAFATEALRDTSTTVSAMQLAAKDMKSQMKTVNLQRVEILQEELQDLMESSNEVQEIMSRSFAVPEGICEADLEAEFEALQDMAGTEEVDTSYLDSLPLVSSSKPVGPAETTIDRKDKELELPK
jgi:charged multivesicular body protein 5